MAQAQQFLRRNPAVRHNADNSRHKKRYKTLHRVKPTDIFRQSGPGQEGTHRSKVRAPNGVLEKVHCSQTNFDVHKRITAEAGKLRLQTSIKLAGNALGATAPADKTIVQKKI